MEPIRRQAVIEAAIAEIGARGNLDVTVSQIAKRAGMSSGLAHHYFGGKTEIFLAAMRHTMSVYGADVRQRLAQAEGPEARLEAVVHAGFSESNFRAEVISAWLNFYVLAQTSDEAARLLRIYRSRLLSNLRHGLRPLIGGRAVGAAQRLAGLIDGLYLYSVQDGLSAEGAIGHVLAALRQEISAQ